MSPGVQHVTRGVWTTWHGPGCQTRKSGLGSVGGGDAPEGLEQGRTDRVTSGCVVASVLCIKVCASLRPTPREACVASPGPV